ncbi:hypothetical protein CYMTET_55392 [Cymbomonas tetramitiformis]|uniref:GS catalytic domain-containing protein n=1 Tax=Cymbomonas tetramitiformis TaxID=36881 RepID=A0AAE0BDE8_9CHLO|nr:hypothetical protein CYMTET_55392 [Cymbomonas tetramitiformis]
MSDVDVGSNHDAKTLASIAGSETGNYQEISTQFVLTSVLGFFTAVLVASLKRAKMGCGMSKSTQAASYAPAPSPSPTTLGNMHANLLPKPVYESSSVTQPAAPAVPTTTKSLTPATLDGYGENAFWGASAEKYLVKQGLTTDTLRDPMWVKDMALADKIAAAVLEWAVDHGANTFCHWFQPMCATSRHGQTGQIWLRGDSIFIPACFVAYTGKALDEKIPLLRAEQAMSREGTRLFKALGHSIDGLLTNIGLEQELFFIPSDAYYKRPDLQMCGRTVLGRSPALGQEGSTHYMAPINTTKSVFPCMQEIQQECYKVGIPLKTRHREVAPNQYEFAPMFGHVVGQIDQNLVAMQLAAEIAPKHGLRALFHEKPFQGVNGSGKHNNWSLSTKCGAQLLNPEEITKRMGDFKVFPIVMAALISGVDKYGDLMRMAIASPGNDFRLGAMEAPPAVISMYLGEDMTKYLTKFMNGEVMEYIPSTTDIDLGVSYCPKVTAPAEDRNRTSPFPYGGHRFEFRAVGSSQNVSMVNTVLAALAARQFKEIADRVEAGESGVAVAQSLLKKHMKSVFNGDGYDPGWPVKARKDGLWVVESGVDAIKMFTDAKNTELFSSLQILTPEEVTARQECMLAHYILTVETEVLCMIDMIKQHIIPSCKKAGVDDSACTTAMSEMESALKAVHAASTADGATMCRTLRLEKMRTVRAGIDELEGIIPAEMWTLGTYKELMFIDENSD